MPLGINPATLVVGIIVLVLLVVALRRLFKRGTCDCSSARENGGGSACSACSGCAASEKMVAYRERQAKQKRPTS